MKNRKNHSDDISEVIYFLVHQSAFAPGVLRIGLLKVVVRPTYAALAAGGAEQADDRRSSDRNDTSRKQFQAIDRTEFAKHGASLLPHFLDEDSFVELAGRRSGIQVGEVGHKFSHVFIQVRSVPKRRCREGIRRSYLSVAAFAARFLFGRKIFSIRGQKQGLIKRKTV